MILYFKIQSWELAQIVVSKHLNFFAAQVVKVGASPSVQVLKVGLGLRVQLCQNSVSFVEIK